MTLCLWLPTFEFRLALVRSPELDATSVAPLDPAGGQRPRIWQFSARAEAAGVQPGMLISRAVALCPALTLLEPDPSRPSESTTKTSAGMLSRTARLPSSWRTMPPTARRRTVRMKLKP